MKEEFLKIPVKVERYEELFNIYDNRTLDKREFNSDIDELINKSILSSQRKIKDTRINLEVYVVNDIHQSDIEELVKKGIYNHYEGYFNYIDKVNVIGIKRISYYLISAIILLGAWSYVNKNMGTNFIGALLNAGGTVLLWEIMSMVFIQRKNLKDKSMLKKKMLNMKVDFKYI
ncbi:MAG: hypothetical protein ACRC7N_19495 [Clostridium sp.]